MVHQLLFALLFSLLISTCYADDSMQYNQQTLPNGDVVTTMTSSDGTKVVSIQHKDGTVETTSTLGDGTKTVTIQRKDGTMETKMTQPNAAD